MTTRLVWLLCLGLSALLTSSNLFNPSTSTFEAEGTGHLTPQMCRFPAIQDSDYPSFSLFLENGFLAFSSALGFQESGNRYHKINAYDHLGRYQFGAETLRLYRVTNLPYFLRTPELQERVFLRNLQRNKWVLRRDIRRFVGLKISGIEITESGILAAAHLAGPGNVKQYLRSWGAVNVADALGTDLETYLERFSGYDLSVVVAKQKPRL